MRVLPSATTFCRVLIGLDRADATGTLNLRAEGRMATLSFESSQVVGANVDRRVASSERQVLESALRICDWDALVLRFDQTPVATSWWKLSEPIPARILALRIMRAAVRAVDAAAVRAELGHNVYHLSETGEAFVRGAELRPEETAVLFWLRRGVPAEELATLPGCGLPGYRFLWMLKLLGAAAPRAGGSYPLLLRKKRELRSRASARKLLDLPDGADRGEARRALRKLVRELHPDRFGDGAPRALRHASGEIVAALVNAEARIASGAAE